MSKCWLRRCRAVSAALRGLSFRHIAWRVRGQAASLGKRCDLPRGRDDCHWYVRVTTLHGMPLTTHSSSVHFSRLPWLEAPFQLRAHATPSSRLHAPRNHSVEAPDRKLCNPCRCRREPLGSRRQPHRLRRIAGRALHASPLPPTAGSSRHALPACTIRRPASGAADQLRILSAAQSPISSTQAVAPGTSNAPMACNSHALDCTARRRLGSGLLAMPAQAPRHACIRLPRLIVAAGVSRIPPARPSASVVALP
jgi:hypothetical protein